MSISKRPFGVTADGQPVTCWRLTQSGGAAVEVIDFGASTIAVEVPDHSGVCRSVCMGFHSVEAYEKSDAYSGAVVGRHAGRIRNGAFSMGEEAYQLSKNQSEHHLHGGFTGFSHRIWDVREDGDRLTCALYSCSGEEGYPGNLSVTVSYQWTGEKELTVTMDARSDADTLVSLTHHGYWNLSGERTVSEHTLQINAPIFVEADEAVLPTGELPAVEETPFDFRAGRVIGNAWEANGPGLFSGYGYDHTFPVPGEGLRELGTLSAAGMRMTVLSTLPTLHVYTGKRTHVALEAQFIPDAVHHAEFPSTVLRAGERWHHVIQYRFD